MYKELTERLNQVLRRKNVVVKLWNEEKFNNSASEELKIFTSELEQGAMKNVPCYESNKRGKNWMAKISINPGAPNGMNRVFCKRAYGDFYYFVNELNVNDIIEFGADYYYGRGNRSSHREYGVIIALSETEIQFALFENHYDAFHLVKKNCYDPKHVLLLEKEHLEKRLNEINQKLLENGYIS
jgi:hypothetical protein